VDYKDTCLAQEVSESQVVLDEGKKATLVNSKILEVDWISQKCSDLGCLSTKLVKADTSESKEKPVDRVGCHLKDRQCI